MTALVEVMMQLLRAAPWHWTAVITLCFCPSAYGGLRWRVEDGQLVERAELVIVGRLERASIRFVDHEKGPGNGASWEHHATLLISECIKGRADATDLPIVIRYGLDPVIPRPEGGRASWRFRDPEGERPDGPVLLFDHGVDGGRLPVDDLQRDQIWFLTRTRLKEGESPRETDPNPHVLGIRDPEAVQPINLLPYFRAHLSDDPERAVRAFLEEGDTELRRRALRYLEHRELLRIAEEPDASIRAQRVLPYYERPRYSTYDPSPADVLRSCGTAAGPFLDAVYESRNDWRGEVIQLWRDIGYTGAADRLIAQIEEHNRAFDALSTNPAWDPQSANDDANRVRYAETYYGVAALADLGIARARPVVEETRRVWTRINYSNPQIVEQCTRFLRRFPAPTTQSERGS